MAPESVPVCLILANFRTTILAMTGKGFADLRENSG